MMPLNRILSEARRTVFTVKHCGRISDAIYLLIADTFS